MSQALQRPRPTQRAAGYIGGGGRERCAECRFFMPASSCTRIEGPVTARGWCRYYSRELSVLRYHPSGAGVGGGVPGGLTLDLSFFGPTLNPLLTFTRGSVATYFDATGTMQTAGMNMVTNSGPLTDLVPSFLTKTAAAIAAPDGTTTGVRFTEDSTASTERYAQWAFTPVGNTTYTGSLYLKAGTRTYGSVQFRVGTNFVGGNGVVTANLTTGVITSATGVVSSSIANIGNGWYRISATVTAVASPPGGGQFRVAMCDSAGNTTYTGDGVSNVYAWGAQLEIGVAPTPYIPTTNAANGAPRFDNDPVTHAALGLLIEEARTNNALNSGAIAWAGNAATLALNAGVAPDGTTTMSRFAEQASTNQHFAWVDTAGLAASTTYVFSVFARTQQSQWLQLSLNDTTYVNGGHATFDLIAGTISGPLTARGTGVIGTASIQAVGGGTYRCSIATTVGAFTTGRTVLSLSNVANPGFAPNYAGNAANGLLVWGAQLEVGAFPTSYIPTTGAAVTRSADQCSILPAGMGFYVSPGGSWMAEFINQDTTATTSLVVGQRAASNQVTPLYINATLNLAQWDGAAVFPTANVSTIGAITKGATTWAAGVGKTECLNGGAVAFTATLGSGYVQIATQGIGLLQPSGNLAENMSGYIRRLRYWPRVLSNAELQQVTT